MDPSRRGTETSGIAGYRVFRNGAQIATTATTTLADTGLTVSTTYAYYVVAYDHAGNISGPSNTVNVTTTRSVTGYVYPLKASANGRYLVDQNNVPFLMIGDSPQALVGNLSEADADFYFANRQAAGFNTLWINLLCNKGTGCAESGSTSDGIRPFLSSDFSQPNEAYFARADRILRLAAKYGLNVILIPAETIGWLDALRGNGVTKDRAFGQYLGNRYKSFDNIIWMSGNDFQTWPNAADDAVVSALAQGIQDADPRHIHTAELNYTVSASLDDPIWVPIIGLDAVYTYYPNYVKVLSEYNRASFKPIFMVESNYEFENLNGDPGTPLNLRHQEYWTQLSGATGQLYGNHYSWAFVDGWKSNLDTPGSVQFAGFLKSLFQNRPWYNLVPDQTHTVVTAGYGTFNSGPISYDSYLTAAATPDGTLAVAYMPDSRAIAVDLTKLAGLVTAQWFDPANGKYTPVSGSPFANTATRQFTPPAANSAGDHDWVLVLDTSP